MSTTRLQLIRLASKRESTAEEWRDRMDDWMNLDVIKIRWPKPVRVYPGDLRKAFASFKSP